MAVSPRIAYFSMEIALDERMPTYAGGLGVLAGDTLRSAADLELPLVGVTLLYRRGYFRQRLDSAGNQREEAVAWPIERHLEELPSRAMVWIEGRQVWLRAWRATAVGQTGYQVPVLFLDSDLPENGDWDRRLTDSLYGGDDRYRLAQELVLGVGGLRMLRALGLDGIERYHLNEGHASLLTLHLAREEAVRTGRRPTAPEVIEAVRRRCLFTTHTPVPAGHDHFPLALVEQVLGVDHEFLDLADLFLVDLTDPVVRHPCFPPTEIVGPCLNMTFLALNLSGYVNGVAKSHGDLARHLLADHRIEAITNGVHLGRWVCPAFARLYDRVVPGWRADNFALRAALAVDRAEIWTAHLEAKRELLARVRDQAGLALEERALTLGFARRATSYKRGALLFSDLDRLRALAADGGLQLVFAGKAHPRDEEGKQVIREIFQARGALAPALPVVYLEDYDVALARLLTAGVDVWLNTPLPPNEASGTSGMKAAANGVPSLSVLDGWWIEGCIEGLTGWAIDGSALPVAEVDARQAADAASLYAKLENIVAPLFHRDRDGFIDVMRHAIALNASFFNTQRMVQEYAVKAYFG